MEKLNLKKITSIFAVIIVLIGGYFVLHKKVEKEPLGNKEEPQEQVPNNTSNDTERSVNSSKPQIVTTQNQVDELFKKALSQESKGDINGAKASLDTALKIQPNDSYIMSYYASLYFHIKDYSNATNWINKALAYRSTDTNFWTIKLDIVKAQSNNDPKSVEPLYLEAINKTDSNINMVTSYASWLGSIGRKQDAIVQWQKAIQIYPAGKTQFQAEVDLLSK